MRDIKNTITELQDVLKNLTIHVNKIEEIIKITSKTLKNNKKVLTCGNGGSASDAEHFAAELSGRYKLDRKALKGISLSSNSSNITCIGNDFGFDKLYSRQVEALGESGDLLVCFTTSGNSKNILEAISAAKKIGLNVICFLGKDGGQCKGLADIDLIVPSQSTARIQEIHILVVHMICDHLDNQFS